MNGSRYEPPKIVTLNGESLQGLLGPSLSCTGFGGAVDGC